MRTITVLVTLAIVLFPVTVLAAKRDVDIPAPDGGVLKATYYSADKPGPAVVLFRNCNHDRTSVETFAVKLSERGIHAVAYDYRAINAGSREDYDKNRTADLRAVHDWLVAQPDVDKTRLASAGGSCGVQLALRFAETYGPEVKGAVVLSGPSEKSQRQYVAKTPSLAVLAAASSEEAPVIPAMKEVVDASKNPHSKMVTLEDAGHGTDMLVNDKKFEATTLDWLEARLAKDTAKQEPSAKAAPPAGP